MGYVLVWLEMIDVVRYLHFTSVCENAPTFLTHERFMQLSHPVTAKIDLMRRIIAGINMTLDGVADHTAVLPDEEVHQHYTDLLSNADAILYGRITYQLMQYWQPMVAAPTGERAMDEFARAIDALPKIVFSHTIQDTAWDSARLATRSLEDEARHLQQQPGRDVLVGSRSLIMQLLNHGLIDEFQLMVHPVIAGSGSPLFTHIARNMHLTLVSTQTFRSGAVLLCYAPSAVQA
jgi:dihydrofolate reductase